MTTLSTSEELSASNKRSFTKLTRALTYSQGQFSLILVRCNHARLRENIVERLQEESSVEIQQLVIASSANTLYTTIQATLKNRQPQALMILGLESVVAINQVIISTNIMRNEFSKQFEFPLVLWVNDEIVQKLIRLAPDFKSWATSTIRFDDVSDKLIEWGALTA